MLVLIALTRFGVWPYATNRPPGVPVLYFIGLFVDRSTAPPGVEDEFT